MSSIFRQVILGVDPGYERCGWAVVAQQERQLKAVAYDCFRTPSTQAKLARYRQLWTHFAEILRRYPVDVIALERVYFSRNVSTALPVSEVRGMLFGQAFQTQIPVVEYGPGSVKVAVTGHGTAPKHQVMQMVARLLQLEKIPNIDDTGDALAVAITHAAHHNNP